MPGTSDWEGGNAAFTAASAFTRPQPDSLSLPVVCKSAAVRHKTSFTSADDKSGSAACTIAAAAATTGDAIEVPLMDK